MPCQLQINSAGCSRTRPGACAHRVLRKAMDEKERGSLPSISKVNVDIFQLDSLMLPVIERNNLGMHKPPEGADAEEEFHE